MRSRKQRYEIRIESHVTMDWSPWFEEPVIRHTEGGETVIRGVLSDQTALHGVLTVIRDLGLSLVEVKRLVDEE